LAIDCKTSIDGCALPQNPYFSCAMSKVFDVIVLGLGAAGSSAVYHLSKTGKAVCGIDQFTPPHVFGSSHGQSRIIRQAYHENPLYVPFVQKAYELWYELEKESGKQLLLKTGGIMLGWPDMSVVTGSELSAKTHGIPYEYLGNEDISTRFPAFKVDSDTVGVLEKEAGILFPEECIKTYLEQAAKNGAQLYYSEKVIAINPASDIVEITTDKSTYYTKKLIVSAGAWMDELLPGLKLPLTIERQVLYWFKTNTDAEKSDFAPQNLPIYIWEFAPGKMFYGFPDLGDGIKVAHHHAGEKTTPYTLNRKIDPEEIELMQEVIGKYLNIKPNFNYAVACMYTNTPDENFIIDYHPQYQNIIVASPCSGHGFKFASYTGKILSNMATDRPLEHDISMFSIARFS
jgi:sarcosine oxidase